MPVGLRRLFREPLVHFLLLGGTAFVVDAALKPDQPRVDERADQPQIVVDDAVRARLREQWMQTHASPPDEADLAALQERWVEQEVLFREGLAQGLAQSDPRIRELLASQMTYVLGTAIDVPEPTPAELQTFFETHATRYAQPERISFTHVFVEGLDAAASAEARRILELLRAGADPGGLGDTFAGGRRFRDRKPADLAERFGPAFVDTLRSAAQGSWVLHRSALGYHLVRVDAVRSKATPSLDDVAAQVRHDWEDDFRSRAITRAIGELREQWDVVVK